MIQPLKNKNEFFIRFIKNYQEDIHSENNDIPNTALYKMIKENFNTEFENQPYLNNKNYSSDMLFEDMLDSLISNEKVAKGISNNKTGLFLTNYKVRNSKLLKKDIIFGMQHYTQYSLFLLEKIEKQDFDIELMAHILNYIENNKNAKNELFFNCIESSMLGKLVAEYDNENYLSFMKLNFKKSLYDMINGNVLKSFYVPSSCVDIVTYSDRLYSKTFFEFVVDKKHTAFFKNNIFTENYAFEKCLKNGAKGIVYLLQEMDLSSEIDEQLLSNFITKSNLTSHEMKHLKKVISRNSRTNFSVGKDKGKEVINLIMIIHNSYIEKQMILKNLNKEKNSSGQFSKKRI